MAMTAGTGVNGFVVQRIELSGSASRRRLLMRRCERTLQVFARASAGKQEPAIAKFAPGVEIESAAFALHVRSEGAAFVRTLMPADPQPAQVIERGICIHCSTAVGIEIFHAHDQGAACVPRPLPGGPEGARMTYMQVSGRRGGKSSAIIRHRS